MTALSHSGLLAAHIRLPSGRSFPAAALFAGAAALASLVLLWRSTTAALNSDAPNTIDSPRELVLSRLSAAERECLPYPPDALSGIRDVNTPYGDIRVYEFGPESGERVLLVHGISTPSIALTDLAHKLVAKGCRVMLFDLFGRGFSAGPSPQTHRYDSALYSSQILLCLQSSALPWTSFTLIGYSLGGAISADFTSYFPNLIRALILIAPGGLIRPSHITWKSRVLYSTSGLLPEFLIEHLVSKRLWTGPETARTIEPEPDTDTTLVSQRANASSDGAPKGGLRSQAVYASSRHGLLPGNLNSTVSNVVDWQILHHQGFVKAFVSSIRHAPIHNQQHRWRVIRENIEQKKGVLTEIWLVLGETDPIIIAEEVAQDATEVLGQDILKVKVIKGSGHEVAIERADEITEVVAQALDLE